MRIKNKKISLLFSASCIVLLLLSYGFHKAIYYSDLIIHPHKSAFITSSSHGGKKALNPKEIGLYYEEVAFITSDGINLRGWFIPENSKKAIILAHGFEANRLKMLKYCLFLARAHYNLLLFDLRYFGESSGDVCSFGLKEKEDIKAAVRFLKNRNIETIGILGESMGAVASILAMTECEDINAAVLDSPFANLRETILYRGQHDKRLNAMLINFIIFISEMRAHYKVDYVDPEKSAEKITRPLFFIYGKKDKKIPFEDPVKIYKKTHSYEKMIWITDSYHTQSFDDNPQIFEKKVLGFFERYLNRG